MDICGSRLKAVTVCVCVCGGCYKYLYQNLYVYLLDCEPLLKKEEIMIANGCNITRLLWKKKRYISRMFIINSHAQCA